MSGTMLLYNLQSPINIGMMLRVAEVYQRSTFIRDGYGVFDREEAKRTISDFAAGALQRRPPNMLDEDQVGKLALSATNRLVVATTSPAASDASTFRWHEHDCVILGNEYDGLPVEIESMASVSVRIPMPSGFLPKPRSFSPIDAGRSKSVANNGEPCLNVATAAAVLCCFSYCALKK